MYTECLCLAVLLTRLGQIERHIDSKNELLRMTVTVEHHRIELLKKGKPQT